LWFLFEVLSGKEKIMDKFTLLARFGNVSLEELTRVQGEFVQMFSRYPDASIT
jgi:hypothetical protein